MKKLSLNIRLLLSIVVCTFLTILLSGCTPLVVPQGGSGSVTIIEGGLVETMVFDGGAELNIQITEAEASEYEYFVQHILTIGRFSPVVGSGFAKRSNIYYESMIGPHGEDTFIAEGETFRVLWREVDTIYGPEHTASVFFVTIEQARF